jgi:hypothetical protein
VYLRRFPRSIHFLLRGYAVRKWPVGKYLGGKSENIDVCVAPGLGGKLGFAASFGKELLDGEMMLDGDLGEEQAALLAAFDQQTVAANFDLLGTNREGRGEQRNFDVQAREFFGTQGREAGILQSGAARATHDAFAEGLAGLDNADAAAQEVGDVKGDENAAGLGEDSAGGNVRRQMAVYNGQGDGFSR